MLLREKNAIPLTKPLFACCQKTKLSSHEKLKNRSKENDMLSLYGRIASSSLLLINQAI